VPFTIHLNGQQRIFDLPEPSSLARLIGELGFQSDRVATELNGAIVPRGRWQETSVTDGDRIELVHFVGGGAPVSSSSRRSHRSP